MNTPTRSTAENTHEIVQRTNDEARVVYVDNDPVVLAHVLELIKPNALAEPGPAPCDEWWPDARGWRRRARRRSASSARWAARRDAGSPGDRSLRRCRTPVRASVVGDGTG